jgi:hypothetical protein
VGMPILVETLLGPTGGHGEPFWHGVRRAPTGPDKLWFCLRDFGAALA